MATLTIGLMDPPYESGNTVTGFRIVDAALRARPRRERLPLRGRGGARLRRPEAPREPGEEQDRRGPGPSEPEGLGARALRAGAPRGVAA